MWNKIVSCYVFIKGKHEYFHFLLYLGLRMQFIEGSITLTRLLHNFKLLLSSVQTNNNNNFYDNYFHVQLLYLDLHYFININL